MITRTPYLRRGFTLMELLVVIAIIALLVSILMPSLQSAKALARLAVCQSTMHNLGLGNAMYAADFDGFSVHGFEAVNSWPSGYGWSFYPNHYFDDDRSSSRKGHTYPVGTKGYYNLWNEGGQNICGVGQLMWDHYIEETAEAIGCPQADFAEETIWTGTHGEEYTPTYQYVVDLMNKPKIDPNNPLPGQDPNNYWRNEYFDGAAPTSAGYQYLRCNFYVRGPLFRPGDILDPSNGSAPIYQKDFSSVHGRAKPDSEIGIFCDAERATTYIMFLPPLQLASPKQYENVGIPVPGWPRRHTMGVNVAYVDGHVAFFFDENRKFTWSRIPPSMANQTNWYGNGWALFTHVYDTQK